MFQHPFALPRALRRKSANAPVLKAGARVTEDRLRNGMRVVVAERHQDPVVASVLLFPCGARNETEREAGVSHFLEHMMFKGSRSYGVGEVDRVTTMLGGQNNAFTGYDHTAYWFEFASDRWEQALDVEADRIAHLTLDAGEFDAERQVVLEELSMGEDDPWRVLCRHVESALFPRHPYGRPIIGYVDTLRAMSTADMRDYYERFYHVGNATLVIGGDVPRERALRAVRKRFAKMAAGVPFERADCFRPPIEDPPGQRRVETFWDDEGRRLVLAWKTVPVGTADDYALDMALIVLASGRMSRLQRRLVFETGLASSISASNDTRVEAGAFWLFAECAQGVEPAELERVLFEELRRIATENVTAAELKRARAVLLSSEAFDGEAVSDFSEELGEWAVDLDWRMAFDGNERHGKVTARMIRDACARYLGPERAVVGWCVPRNPTPVVRPHVARRKKAKAARSTKKSRSKSPKSKSLESTKSPSSNGTKR